ncbi:thermostable carboxypeptidase 1 [Abditibacteriota bacterium]|nr:thermostable carboxypeptidase 1 [Abditibacteriota bacterium]
MQAEQKTPAAWDELLERLGEVADLRGAGALAHWDQATLLPSGAAQGRGHMLGTLSKLAHEKFIDERLATLLGECADFAEENLAEGDDFPQQLLATTRREYDRATRVPSEFEARFAAHSALIYSVWEEARSESNFQKVAPLLEKTLDLSRELAGFFPHDHIADPLIDMSDTGETVQSIRAVFAPLREQLVPLVREVASRPVASSAPLHGDFSMDAQKDFAVEAVKAIGYDWTRGRMDFSAHPFMTKFAPDDVRITVRGDEEFGELFFSALHEAGHALYEQNIARRFGRTPLDSGTSSGVHESQSRLWENLVGRSNSFWNYWFPRAQAQFPSLRDFTQSEFVAAINVVKRSLTRTESDELTYNLHVLIRFDLELEMLEGKLAIQDLPAAWNARYESDLGLTPPDDARGCLQDVHWFSGTIGGAFQGYTLGNILAAQLFESAQDALGDLDSQFARGQYSPLREWLTQNVHRYGAGLLPRELVVQATGRSLELTPYLNYLRHKFAA